MAATRRFPRKTLEQALRVPQALKQHNNGNPWSTEEVAKALKVGPKSGNFFYITASAKDYGLTDGTRETAEIKLAPLGRQAVYPNTPQEAEEARVKAFLNVELFKKVLEYYGGNNLPEREFLSNTLLNTFAVPIDQQDEFVDIFTKNCKFLGIGQAFDIAGIGTTRPRKARDMPPQAGEEGESSVAVGHEGEDEDRPVCFVIMPFSERSEDHAPGFFDEVLEELFTPAAEEAGFKVRTARRHGSDLIHETIVNDLLNADLVLCDLTEHNPNVLFELGLRMMEGKPVAIVRATGTQAIFDVNAVRFVEYDSNLWPSTVREDIPAIRDHIKATYEQPGRTYISMLRHKSD